jgi:hypothetical protein
VSLLPPLPPAPDDDALRAHLVATRIAGDVVTSREENLRNFGRMSSRDERYLFGLAPRGSWTPEEVLAVMVEKVGVHADPEHAWGQDTIDPDLTLAALRRFRDRLARAADSRERVLVATGHPTGVLALHAPVAAALAARGCELVSAGELAAYRTPEGAHREVRYLAGVAMVSNRGDLCHTHSAEPVRLVLDALAAAGEGPPGLVVADHGWAGGAGRAGVPAIGYADCNDPALFVGEAEGAVEVAVPLDDNVAPLDYLPLAAWLLAGWAPGR